MNTTNDRSATVLAERCAMMDKDDELCSVHLSDEEILLAFFKDGCDLDGTPLLMASQRELNLAAACRPGMLH